MKKSNLQRKSWLSINSLFLVISLTATSCANAYGFKGVDIGTVANFDDIEERVGLKCESLEGYKSFCAGETTILGGSASAHISINEKNIINSISIKFDPNSFDSIRNSLVKKYGKYKTIDSEKLTNAMGAKFTQITIKWRSNGKTIYLTKYSSKVTEGDLWIANDEYMNEMYKIVDKNEKDI